MSLSRNLLIPELDFGSNSMLNGTTVKGSYSTMQFVLRLRDDVRTVLNREISSETISEAILASSTAIHENIHWWQHVGSNFGLLFSLAYPAFFHVTKKNFDNIVRQELAYKSIIKFDQQYYDKNNKADISDVNIILNNYYDLEYAKVFALDNRNIYIIQRDHRFFLNMGHCYHIFWSATVHTLAGTIDHEYRFLPNTNEWVENFKLLAERKTKGFYVDSPMSISSLGIKAIYEGQAIFNQVQYLASTIYKDWAYANFEDKGMLYGIYTEAFELFLKVTGLEKPISVLNPIVGLFLLVCDLSINPTNGFPMDIYDYENFIIKNDPGIRFALFCKVTSENAAAYVGRIKLYSKEEYVFLSKDLSANIGCACPYEAIRDVLEWSKRDRVAEILKEESELKFADENLVIRLMFSKYYRFQEDKLKYPNVFCWFGYHATSENSNTEFEIVDSLYKKHHALFQDDYDGEIKPTIFEGCKEENVMESFNAFYFNNILYDLVLRWVREEGEFRFDYKWLVNERSDSFIPFVKEEFEKQFGMSLDNVVIL